MAERGLRALLLYFELWKGVSEISLDKNKKLKGGNGNRILALNCIAFRVLSSSYILKSYRDVLDFLRILVYLKVPKIIPFYNGLVYVVGGPIRGYRDTGYLGKK